MNVRSCLNHMRRKVNRKCWTGSGNAKVLRENANIFARERQSFARVTLRKYICERTQNIGKIFFTPSQFFFHSPRILHTTMSLKGLRRFLSSSFLFLVSLSCNVTRGTAIQSQTTQSRVTVIQLDLICNIFCSIAFHWAHNEYASTFLRICLSLGSFTACESRRFVCFICSMPSNN